MFDLFALFDLSLFILVYLFLIFKSRHRLDSFLSMGLPGFHRAGAAPASMTPQQRQQHVIALEQQRFSQLIQQREASASVFSRSQSQVGANRRRGNNDDDYFDDEDEVIYLLLLLCMFLSSF